MIGQRIESIRTFPWFSTLLLLLAGFLVYMAVQQENVNLVIGALMPFAIASGLLATRPPKFVGFFREEGLEIQQNGILSMIPFDNIERIWVNRKKIDPAIDGPPNYEIAIGHTDGQVRIPKRLNIPADEVYRYLVEHVPITGSDEIHQDLTQYHRDHTGAFGPERVWSYRVGKHRMGPRYPRLRMASFAIIAVGIAWIGIGATGKLEIGSGWIGGGVGAIFYGALMLLASYASNRPIKFRGWKDSSLIVSPLGLALVQGDVRGEMKWDELKDVRLGNKKYMTSFTLTSNQLPTTGLVLVVDGAELVVHDIYDRPIASIHQAIRHYWNA